MAETSGVSYNKEVGNNETVVNIFENEIGRASCRERV